MTIAYTAAQSPIDLIEVRAAKYAFPGRAWERACLKNLNIKYNHKDGIL